MNREAAEKRVGELERCIESWKREEEDWRETEKRCAGYEAALRRFVLAMQLCKHHEFTGVCMNDLFAAFHVAEAALGKGGE